MHYEQSIECTSPLDTLTDAVIFLDQTATILSANEKAGALLGTHTHELPGHILWQAAPQLVTIYFYQAVLKALRTRTPLQVEYHSPVTQTWFYVYLVPTNAGIALFFHEEMAPTLLPNTLLQHEEGQLDLLERVSEWVAILTHEGLLLDINQRPLTDAQVQRGNVIGKPFTQFPGWSSDPVAQEQLRTAIAQASRGDSVRFRTRVQPQAGWYLDLALTLTPHRDGNQQVEYLICIGRDITEREQQEAELRALIEAIPQFVWTAGSDGHINYNNQRLIDYLMMPLQKVEGNGWLASIHPDDRQRVRDTWRNSIHTGKPYEVEHRMRDGTSGEYRWFLVRGVPQRDAQGTIQSWIGTCTDIDEKKQAEEMIKVSEQHFRMLAEVVPQLVWTTQPDGKIEYANQRALDFVQTDLEHVRDYRWRQFVHPEDIKRTTALRQRSREAGGLYEDEYRIKDGRTGAYRWFLARAYPVRDEMGQIVKWFGTGTDIDKQKRIEEALRQSQEQAQTLMNSNVIGIIRIDGDNIIKANKAFLYMTGYSQEDLRDGRLNWMHMTAPEYIEITQQAHQQLALYEYMTPYEKEYICKDGSRLPVLVGGVTTQLDPSQTICFVLDNSARKALEQRKDTFLSMASHELKTPLTSLKLQTQLLKKQLVRQDIRKAEVAISRMEGQLNTVTRLVEELFDLSNIQSGKLAYAWEIVNLNELLQEIVEVLQQTQATHTIVLPNLSYPILLLGDRDRLGQVFLNLLNNAIKYSPDADRVEIDISVSADAVTIGVRDYGMGIPQEQHEKIFERFYRAPGQQQGMVSGLGIGLYIVAEIVKHHKGTITVESEVGTGSTFQVTLPLK